jgi:tripartite-type tricarboxylate transporter receptor subunit TctC
MASAQAYPSRPIMMIVPFSAGGPMDTVARIVAERMKASLGQSIMIENVTGANGSIGVGRVVRAAPDGYTFLIGSWNTHVANGALYSLQYDLLNDFQSIALLGVTPYVIVAKKAMPANDLKSLIAWLKANPDCVTQGHAGIGGGGHVAGLLLQRETGTRFQLVPYRGGGPAMQDLVGGHIDLMIDAAILSLPQLRAGTIKAYAVTSKSRLESAPDIPTVDEAGLPGFYLSNWYGLWAAKSTPKDAIARLNFAAADSLADPMVRRRFAELGHEIPPREQQTPEVLAAFQKEEIEKWWPIIKAAGIQGE